MLEVDLPSILPKVMVDARRIANEDPSVAINVFMLWQHANQMPVRAPGIESAESHFVKRSEYNPKLSCGTRVRFIGKGHRKSGQLCTIIRILPNPSLRAENQWYDVRFDDHYSIGRFIERYLTPVTADEE
jgi:hypothetical protein